MVRQIIAVGVVMGGAKGAVAFCRHAHAKALDRAVFPGVMAHATGAQLLAKAICFGEAGQPSFKELMERVVRNAQRLAGALADRGYVLVSGGTQTHLMIVDVRSRGLTGKEAERRLQAGGLLANKQLVPADPEKPTVCSGIRIGTPCSASRGMGEPELDRIAGFIDRLLGSEDPADVRAEVAEMAGAFPLP